VSGSQEQSYRNHKMFSPLYHFGVMLIAPVVWIASIVYLIKDRFSYASLLLFGLSVCVVLLAVLVRTYALKLQDRIIRQEENFRHLVLAGKPLDARLTMKQVIALRFAEDDAFPALCTKAAETGMSPDEIKKSITRWRADHYRV